ncbi:hypothetical protein [Stratiformator vulcanicus]|uniref:Uncharacterized protein n=1 Tax=Stratiformator vulcanicus TaxID=2527980 RepID=A0A517QWB8_9PLAN|nr:hypothetical protein [Stratiformator vulcanicus]QDT35956.1 hypothetical protein Pan189_03110 [Stratiformator vulcanicus]
MRFATLLTVISFISSMSHAEELRLANSSDNTIVMRFLPSNRRPRKMDEISIPPSENGSVTRVSILGQDPYDVSFYLKPKSDSNGTIQVFHAKVGRPIPLRALARDIGQFDVSLAIAAKDVQGRVIFQASGATLDSEKRSVEVFSGETDSSFANGVLKRQWETVYKAGNGKNYGARVEFGKLTFETSDFAGRFTDLAVFEDDKGCHLAGRWTARNSKGDVFFTVYRNAPTALTGEYTFDGKRDRYSWKSK